MEDEQDGEEEEHRGAAVWITCRTLAAGVRQPTAEADARPEFDVLLREDLRSGCGIIVISCGANRASCDGVAAPTGIEVERVLCS
jgi:hypothetical protein